MREGDLEGDMDSDCLMLDRNRDGHYGSGYDLIVDWNDEDGNGEPDMQVVADNSGLDDRGRFEPCSWPERAHRATTRLTVFRYQ